MRFAFSSSVFASILLLSSASAPSMDDIMKLLEKQGSEIQELHNKIAALNKKDHQEGKNGRHVRGSGFESRRILKGSTKDGPTAPPLLKGQGSLDRNICYENTPELISIWAACDTNESGDYYYDTDIDCSESGGTRIRRKLSEDEAKKAQEAYRRRRLEEDCSADYTSGDEFNDSSYLPVGSYDVGAIEIKDGESLMIELTAGSWTGLWNDHTRSASSDDDSYTHTDAGAGLYVTATLWENCGSPNCVGTATEILPEPEAWIPLQESYAHRSIYQSYDGSQDSLSIEEDQQASELSTTSTVKLFFPDTHISAGVYYVTLEFKAEVYAYAAACDEGFAYVWAGAAIGPHIIDAQIIKDGNFGDCSMLNHTLPGCGLFDELSGDVNCEDYFV